jgi:hypothetical protein
MGWLTRRSAGLLDEVLDPVHDLIGQIDSPPGNPAAKHGARDDQAPRAGCRHCAEAHDVLAQPRATRISDVQVVGQSRDGSG